MASITTNITSGSQHRGSAKLPSSSLAVLESFDPFTKVLDPSIDTMGSRRHSTTVSSRPLDRNSYHAPPSCPSPRTGHPQLAKSQSTRAVMSTMTPRVDLSPVVKKETLNGPTYGRSHSLIGFDPLATPATTASTASPMVYSTTSSPMVYSASAASSPIGLPKSPRPMINSAASSPMGLPKSPRFGRQLGLSKLTPEPLPLLAPLDSSMRPPSPAPKKTSRLSRIAPQQKKKPLTPAARTSTDMDNKHRRDVQSFCISDLRAVSSEAMEQENLEDSIADIFGISSSSNMDSGGSKLEFSASSILPNKLDTSSEIKPKNPASLTPRTDSKSIEIQQEPPEQPKDVKGMISRGLASPRKKIMNWSKKAHHRIKSLDTKDAANAAAKAVSAINRSSLPNTPIEGARRSSMYPAMIQDLMELSFSQLQMPTLAKPSPTSFLTGKEDEVVRTCELDPSPHQMEIPKLREFVVAARLNEFIENYRRVDQNIDLQQWVGMNRMDLQEIKIAQHQPIAQSLLECGDDVCLQGVITKGASADERTEMVIFEGQRQFTVACRGTTEQQCKLGLTMKSKKNRIAAVPLDAEHPNVDVYSYFKEEYTALEAECFALLDKLTEQNPFCDLCFTGHSFGAAIATLAAFRYANARPMMRVSCITFASPKVGFSAFKQLVNSSPNLKVMRLEYGQDGKCQLPSLGGYHVGHTLVLHGSLGHNSLKTNNKPVLAYKFDAPKYKKFKTTHPDLRSYVNALEEVARLGLPWAEDFVGTSGQGVVVNNEPRQVV